MRYIPDSSSTGPGVSATVYAPGQHMVDADLNGLGDIAALLATISSNALDRLGTALSIGWDVPLTSDLMSLGTAADYSADIAVLTRDLTSVAARAQLLSSLMLLTSFTYSDAENQAVGTIAQLRLPLDLAMVAFSVAQSEATVVSGPNPPDSQKLISPEDVSWTLRTIADATGGSYTKSLSKIDDEWQLFGSGLPVTTLSAVPGDEGTQPITSISTGIAKVDDLYENTNTAAHIEVQRVFDPKTQKSTWLLVIPGTNTWDIDAQNPADSTGNLDAEAGRPSALEAAAWSALAQARKKEGDTNPADPVMIIGHSQGGIVATNMARHAADHQTNITRIATFGSPTGELSTPSKVAVLNVENDQDMVPALDALATGDKDPNRTIVELHDPNSMVKPDGKIKRLQAHNPTQYGRDFAASTQNLPSSNAASEFITNSSQFFSPHAHAYIFNTSRPRILSCPSKPKPRPKNVPAFSPISDRAPQDIR